MSLRTIDEASQELRISRSSLYRLWGRGDGPRAVKVGGKTFVPADAIAGWLATQPHPFEKPDAA
jgi:predicted DNA-binding transcriptional regulator AlpA